MKNFIIFTLAIVVIFLSSCKKEDVEPQVITNTEYVHDTTFLMPRSELIHGTWHCYAYSLNGSTTKLAISPTQTLVATATTFSFESAPLPAVYTFDYKYIYLNNSPDKAYTVFSTETELYLLMTDGRKLYLRR